MSTTKNKILEKRKRLEIQKEKSEARLKAIQLKLKIASQRIAKAEKTDDLRRIMILGNFVFEKMKIDPSFKAWLDGEIGSSSLSTREKNLFGISQESIL